eukprot:CAMPEP_0181212586 /NCGR_PEP_ID=MMETSP1096-20121128/24429_1 /TAXON_ID=156174 ORGANISM="Chrysochromulina ericina, Strain CCMP281" /NCGR_SAMPLE_ID=MMETSP1096 /ASSEMBLY_ACC=CAM_ASM_000453 /LENGTH=68 /DNA_ID=CAMNT_0023304125 /DNA_START=545 /DNA_END=751 /DNA_ORIENTATION=+
MYLFHAAPRFTRMSRPPLRQARPPKPAGHAAPHRWPRRTHAAPAPHLRRTRAAPAPDRAARLRMVAVS